jgi:C4-dicarboxylate-specific signal transduction histidine kinase
MGEMAAAIAHELNQPLGAILGNVGVAETLLAADHPDVDELREVLSDIREADRRATEIIRGIRTLLRRHEFDPQLLDLNELVRATLRLIAPEASRRRTMVVQELSPGVPPIRADRVQLQQVLINMLVNAMDALSACPVEERRLTVATGRDGQFVVTSIADEGPGIAQEVLGHIFEPFYTTKKDGMGMGLSLSRTIVEAHGGRIEAWNRLETGAVFRFLLPAIAAPGEKVAPS